MKKLSSLLLVLVMIFSLCGCEQETTGTVENISAVVEGEETTIPLVYRTETGEKYHRESCIHLKSKIETTVEEALSMGLGPCSVCKPPQ